LRVLLMAVFVVVQVTALSHEFEHVMHRHDAPCGLHVAADHLVIVSAPEPARLVGPAPSTGHVPRSTGALVSAPRGPSRARAPPSCH
jgi:hypothetical protein